MVRLKRLAYAHAWVKTLYRSRRQVEMRKYMTWTQVVTRRTDMVTDLAPGSIFPSSSAWPFPAAAAIDILCESITSRAVSFFFVPALIGPQLFLPSLTTSFSVVFTPSSRVSSIVQSGSWATSPVIGVSSLHS